jgi:predicted nucleic acid-binding Zn ribbon protein
MKASAGKKVLDQWRGYRGHSEPRLVRTLSEIIPSAMAQIGLAQRFRESVLQDHWREVMGEFVAAHTRPAGIGRNVLTVEVDHSGWLHEMTLFHKKAMLHNLHKRFADLGIKDIKFRLRG